MNKKNVRKTIINGLVFYNGEDLLREKMKSKKFREAYEQEVTRTRLIKQVRELRTKKRLTQKMLAKKADMPQSVIARLESGEHSFSLTTLSKIAHAVGKEVRLV